MTGGLWFIQIPGDIDLDGCVDIVDLNLVLSDLGKEGFLLTDVNDDGFVDAIDLTIVLIHFGKCE